MTASKHLFRLLPLAALLAAGSASATNGYFSHGYGIKAKGMGGASTAMAVDSMGGANNPASMAFVGERYDIGLDLFSPKRDAQRSGAGFATLNGKVESESTLFYVPEFGYNRMLGKDLAVGLTVYGNGGMNTNYPQGNFNCGAGPANMLCGGGPLGVDLSQLIIAPTLAYKLNDRHAVGAALLLGYQQFKAYGLQAFDNAPGFPPFTGAPGNVTNQGYDRAKGVGLRLGYLGRLSEQLSVGAAYAPKMNMGRFDKYKGLFADGGDFDIPAHFSVGLAFQPMPALTVALDYERIKYSGIKSVGNPSLPAAPLGAATGPGFGWGDIDVMRLGLAWRQSEALTLRAGFNKGGNPIQSADVTFNILAPGVVTDHYTAGLSWAVSPKSEISASLMVAARKEVTGSSLFNMVLGAGAAGSETIGMRQTAFGLAWGHKF